MMTNFRGLDIPDEGRIVPVIPDDEFVYNRELGLYDRFLSGEFRVSLDKNKIRDCSDGEYYSLGGLLRKYHIGYDPMANPIHDDHLSGPEYFTYDGIKIKDYVSGAHSSSSRETSTSSPNSKHDNHLNEAEYFEKEKTMGNNDNGKSDTKNFSDVFALNEEEMAIMFDMMALKTLVDVNLEQNPAKQLLKGEWFERWIEETSEEFVEFSAKIEGETKVNWGERLKEFLYSENEENGFEFLKENLEAYYEEGKGHHYFLDICIYNTYLFKPYFPLGSKELEEAQLELNKIYEERGKDWATNPFNRAGKSVEDFFKNTPNSEKIVDRINDLMETIKKEGERYKDAKYDDRDSWEVFVEALQETIKEVDGIPRDDLDDLWDIETLISDIEEEKKRAIKILSKQNGRLIKAVGVGLAIGLTGGIAGIFLAPVLAPGIMSALGLFGLTQATGATTVALSSGVVYAFTQTGSYAFWGAAAATHALATIGGSVAGGTAVIASAIGASAGISGAAATAAAQSIFDNYVENADKIAIYSLAEKIALCKIIYLKYPKEKRGGFADFDSAEKIVESIKTDIGIHRKSLDELKDKVNSSNAQSKEEKKEADKNKELLKMQEKVLEVYELARENLQKMIAAWR